MAGGYAKFRLYCATAMALAALVLAGCAGTPEIPYDRSASAKIKTIGIVTPYTNGPNVVLATTVGQSFGLVGALVDAGMKANRDSRFTAIMQSQNFAADAYFLSCLSEQLRAEGYLVVMIPVVRTEDNFLATYPGSAPPSDAYLDVSEFYGYLAAGVFDSNPYRPYFSIRARLVNASDSTVLMQDVVIYNPLGSPKNMVTIAPDPALQYVDFDTLAADPSGAINGLKTAELKTAQALAGLLK